MISKVVDFEVLDNLAPVEGLTKPAAKTILKEIKSNPLHRIFVAVLQEGIDRGLMTVQQQFVERKFIFGGGRVAHIEDVAVRVEYQRKGIGFKLVNYATEQGPAMRWVRRRPDCSNENIPFYEKMGYSYHGNTMKIQHTQDVVT